jgi:two-component system, CitB family, sensor kinase
VVSLAELGHPGRAVDFATAVLARSHEIHESISSTVADPVLAALLTGKAVCADKAGVMLHVDPATSLPPTGLPSQDLVLVLGNLVDNGIDAAAATPPPRWVHVLARVNAGRLRLEVSDSGPGLPAGRLAEVFTAGWSTKGRVLPGETHGQGLGLALVADAVRGLGGGIEIGRWVGARFTVDIPLAPGLPEGGSRATDPAPRAPEPRR